MLDSILPFAIAFWHCAEPLLYLTLCDSQITYFVKQITIGIVYIHYILYITFAEAVSYQQLVASSSVELCTSEDRVVKTGSFVNLSYCAKTAAKVHVSF